MTFSQVSRWTIFVVVIACWMLATYKIGYDNGLTEATEYFSKVICP
jgi:hypothetical protein